LSLKMRTVARCVPASQIAGAGRDSGRVLPVAGRMSEFLTRIGSPPMPSDAPRSGMPGHFGIRHTELDKDRLVGEMEAGDRHLNAGGIVHGGALAAFADDLGGALAGLNAPKGFRTTTIESKTNIFRAC